MRSLFRYIHSFSTHLSSACCVPGIVWGAEETSVKKITFLSTWLIETLNCEGIQKSFNLSLTQSWCSGRGPANPKKAKPPSLTMLHRPHSQLINLFPNFTEKPQGHWFKLLQIPYSPSPNVFLCILVLPSFLSVFRWWWSAWFPWTSLHLWPWLPLSWSLLGRMRPLILISSPFLTVGSFPSVSKKDKLLPFPLFSFDTVSVSLLCLFSLLSSKPNISKNYLPLFPLLFCFNLTQLGF